MCAQLAMQHGKEGAVREQMEYKLDRQLKRINEDDTCDKHRQDWRQQMMRKFDRRRMKHGKQKNKLQRQCCGHPNLRI